MLQDDACRVVHSSFHDGWLSKNRDRKMEVSGDRGKAVWYALSGCLNRSEEMEGEPKAIRG